ncbi:hypothetical protein DFO66_10926 [Brevibacterium sanguinis]|uniref:Uncharacterized protein n=2 Tax=Brevibacterium TaxID=1696 RepID=A0A366IIG2_9MICO|nr:MULTISPECIES: hypothetical protein [Brevibacterium]RBP63596.1 hypothetical protein DFO66_10926 [Brevibacterium sanguinis]RBP70255.1 hypothetical protein DFO65_10926 [Brevibacterium celere]
MTGIPKRAELSRDTVLGMLLDTSPYLSCDDCFDRLDEFVERRLTEPDFRDEPMEVHLAGCEACAEEACTLAELLG